ncbi:MAG: hypothetical protein Q9184_001926 [Pyrenodesmia sp. 2 TL-2023]
MLRHTLLLLTVNLLSLIDPSAQVDITLTGAPQGHGNTAITTTCTNIRPGTCCIVVTFEGARTVRFNHLFVGDIAAVWGPDNQANPSGPFDACARVVLESRPGPGTWVWASQEQGSGAEVRATGASFIRMPTSLPPDPKTSIWLQAEGMLGMIWGSSGAWFVHEGAKARWGPKVRPRSKMRRDIRSAEKGKLWARSPPRAVFPDMVEIDGEVYRGDGSGNTMFTDGRGGKVNLTELWL